MWFDQQPPSIKHPLTTICSDSLPPKAVKDHAIATAIIPRPDTIDEMITENTDNNTLDLPTVIAIEIPIISPTETPDDPFHNHVIGSKDKLCFLAYEGANTLRPRWYLVQIMLDDNDSNTQSSLYHVAFFRCHPDDIYKTHDIT